MTNFDTYSRRDKNPKKNSVLSPARATDPLASYTASLYFLAPECDFRLHPTVQYSSRDSSHPQSVAVADFNSDGHIDLVVVNTGFDNVIVHLGYGDDSFPIQTTYPMGLGSAPRMVAIGDFNNDTLPDIVVANFGINNLAVLFGNGESGFRDQIQIETSPTRPMYVVVGDFNSDSCSDIAFIGYGTDSVGVLSGFCTSTFETPRYFSTGYDSLPYSIAVGDFDNDSRLDLAVANYGTDNIGLFFGLGDGTFTTQTICPTGSNSGPHSIAISDLNNDTHLDVAVVCSDSNSITLFFGKGNGSFAESRWYSTGINSNPIFIAIADFDNDDKPDITVLNNGTNNIALFLGYGNGTFINPISYSTGPRSSPCSIGAADFDSDNRLDIAIANQQNNNLKIFKTSSHQIFTNETIFRTISDESSIRISSLSVGLYFYPISLVMNDFNNDGYLDIAAVYLEVNSVCIFLAYDYGQFSPPTIYFTGSHSGPWSLTADDFNEDGRMDIAVTNYHEENVAVFLGYGNGEFSSQTTYFTGVGSKPHWVVAEDFNNDGHLDLVVANSLTDNVGIFFGKGNGQFSTQVTYFTGPRSDPCSLIVGDLNKDGQLDIVVANFNGDSIGVFLGYGNGDFSSLRIYSTGSNSEPVSPVIGDFNNDGRIDIAVANSRAHNIGIFLADSMQELSPQITYSSGANSNPYSIIADDFNNDGQQDIATANYHKDSIAIFLGSGTSDFLFQKAYFTGTNTGPISIVSGDFNNDGRVDLAVANYRANNIGVFLGSGTGDFSSQTTYFTGSNSKPISIICGDVNNDGRQDLAIANSGSNNVVVFLGSDTGNFLLQTTFFTGANSSPISIGSGDFNNDGQLDLAVANNGTNDVIIFLGSGNGSFSPSGSYFVGVDSEPISIVTGDFNNDGRLDFVVASCRAGNISVFLGYAKNEFLSKTTYVNGTNSCPMSLISVDYNVDGHLDIAFTNSRKDNLGFLLGYGTGEFSPLTTYSTGSGSAPAAIIIRDFNNDRLPDIAVANYGTGNIGVFLSYKNPTFSFQRTYFISNNSKPNMVVAGDFNNDGWQDIAVANFAANNVGIFLQQENNEFSSQIAYFTGTGSGPYSLAVGDFNNDGPLDIAVANIDANNFGILLGYGDGEFSPQRTYFTGNNSGPSSIVTADFNNDSRLDIAVANFRSDNIGIFLGYGNGEFSSQTTYLTGRRSGPGPLTTGDLNNDGRLDIAVVNYHSNSVGVFFGRSDGRFASQKTYSTGAGSDPYSIIITDLNNDGRQDIVVTNFGNSNFGVFLGVGNGELSTQTTFPTGRNSGPASVVARDFNNDGRQDIFVVNQGIDSVGIFLGCGNGKFLPQRTYMTGSYSGPVSIVVVDFNNDGRLDIAVANCDKDNVGLIFGYSDRLFLQERSYAISMKFPPKSIAACDFNNDGQLDFAVAIHGENKLSILLGYGGGEFSTKTTYFISNESDPYSIVAQDFNNDGRKDIVIANYHTNNIVVFLGNGAGDFATQMTCSTGNNSSPTAVVAADFNNDGRPDIAVANYQGDNLGIFLGSGSGEFLPQMSFSTGTDSGPHAIVASDFNSDGLLDVAVVNYRANNVGILLGQGKGRFSSPITYFTGSHSGPYALATGDLNNDGQLDIVVANYRADNVGVFFGYGSGMFSSQTTYSTGDGSHPSSVIIADLNNDGPLDVAVTNYGTNNVGLLLGYGNGQFSAQTTYYTGNDSGPVAIIASDLNRDGRLDMTVANYGTKELNIFLGFGSLELSPQTKYFIDENSQSRSIAIGDLNNDGRLDITVTNTKGDNVGVFLGYGNGQFAPQTTYFTGKLSGPDLLIVTDWNNDGDMDIVVANRIEGKIVLLSGQGSGDFPSIIYPSNDSLCSMLVAAGNFNNDGHLDIVAANYNAHNLGVLLGHGNGTFKSPLALSTGNSSFPISIAVGDFDNDHQLDIAVANYGTSNIGVFLGYGNGTFRSLLVFSTGIGSCPRSLAVGDFNNEEGYDIVVADYCKKNIVIFLDFKDGKFSSQRSHRTPDNFGPIWIVVADFNHDNRFDLAAAADNDQTVGILLGSDNGSFQSWTMIPLGAYPHPKSLALGDFNNDSNTDIAVGNGKFEEEHVLILLGTGDGNFLNKGRYFTGTQSGLCSMVIDSFNNDSQLDIAVINTKTKTISVLLGHGDGTFSAQRNYSTTNNLCPISATAGDFNNDNLTDLVVAHDGTYAVGIFLAYIETNFIDERTIFTGSAAFPGSIALGDFTNDGLLDIAVGNDGTHDINILINSGNGKFAMQIAYLGDSTFYPTSIIVSDFNNDQQLDTAVANSDMNSLSLLYGEGNGTFGNLTTFSTGENSNPQSIAVGDFNNDNKTDIVLAYSGTGSVGLFLKMDSGAFQNMTTLSTGFDSSPQQLTVVDFDKDGQLDIAVANRDSLSAGLFFGLGDGTFSEQKLIFLGEDIHPFWISFGNFNNDEWLDVVVSDDVEPATVIVLLGNDDGSFRSAKTYLSDPLAMGAVGDVNNDGDLDLVFCQSKTSTIAVLLGYGDGSFRKPMIYSTGGSSTPISVILKDFNNDSRLDIAVANINMWNIGIRLGSGNGKFSSQKTYSTTSYGPPFSITTSDFNNDDRPDIVISFFLANIIGILSGHGDGTFQHLVVYPIGDLSLRQSINAGDFNNDGRLDLVYADTDANNIGILLGHVNGTFFNEITHHTGNNSYPNSIGLGDFNNDGRLDIAVSNMLTNNIGIFLGYASEDFASTTARSIGNSSQPVSIAVADFNNDACLDVVVADRENNRIVIVQGSGYGTFLDQQAYSTGNGSSPNWVVVEDFNQDQYLDIAVVNSGTNNVGIFLGYGDGTFSELIPSSASNISSPVSLSAGYFNNDTYLDIAVASSGNNYVCILFGYGNGSFDNALCRTSGYDSRPSAVACGDVNGDTITDVVIANKGSSTIEILTKIC